MAIYRRGRTYWARWSKDGKRHRRSLETQDRHEAQRRYEKLKSKPRRITVRPILRRWVEHKAARSRPRSLAIYKVARKRFTLLWGHLEPHQITTQRIEAWQDQALRTGLAPRTINTQTTHVLAALKWAGYPPPPYQRLKVHGRPARKYLTASEVAKLLIAVREPRWQRLEVVVMLALYAGLRRDEIIWLTWDDVDLADGWLHVRSKKGWSPKSTSSERSIPLAEDLASYLATLRSEGWVAPQSQGVRWCRQNLGGEIRRLFRCAGVDDGGPHTLHRLRGTFATTVLRAGGDLESLREVLGHSLLSVTAGYLAATSESKRRAIQGVRFTDAPR